MQVKKEKNYPVYSITHIESRYVLKGGPVDMCYGISFFDVWFLIKTRMLDIENEHNLLTEKSMYIFREALKKIILFL